MSSEAGNNGGDNGVSPDKRHEAGIVHSTNLSRREEDDDNPHGTRNNARDHGWGGEPLHNCEQLKQFDQSKLDRFYHEVDDGIRYATKKRIDWRARQLAVEKLVIVFAWCSRKEKHAPPPGPETVLMRFLVAAASLSPDRTVPDRWQRVAKFCGATPEAVWKEAERFRKRFMETNPSN